MNSVVEDRGLRYGNWNSYSVLNKKFEIKLMLHIHKLDVLIITETWLSNRVPVRQIRGYLTFRQDRQSYWPWGGVMILVRNNFVVSLIKIPIGSQNHLDCVRINLITTQFKLQFLEYMPLGPEVLSIVILEGMILINWLTTLNWLRWKTQYQLM